jgi:phosphatidylserine/phosphatidylglycerophosphate/cardiolipin synthase-like enzyme
MTLRTGLVLFALAALASPSLAQEPQIVFSPHEQQDVEISKELLKAKSSIYMALYSISHESDWVDDPGPTASQGEIDRHKAFRTRLDKGEVKVFDMIKRKSQEEGVKCRLILNRAALDSWAVDRAKAYEAIGVEVRWTHKTMHHKFAVVDRKVLINGSGNWSRGAAERYSENTAFFRNDRRLVWRFLREFYFLWYTLPREGKAESFDEALLPVAQPDVNFFVSRKVRHSTKRAVEAYFTSENTTWTDYTCADKIVEEMRAAKKQILVMVNHFNMRRIGSALIQINNERNKNADPSDDVQIKVLMDLGEYDATAISQSDELEKAGIECRYKFYSLSFYYRQAQFMHHKVLITDSERVVTGSYNWSRTAEHKNYENITVHQGPSQQALVAKMKGEFERLWDLRRDAFQAFKAAVLSKPGDADYKRVVPVHFVRGGSYYHTPMTLTRAEIESVRKPLEAVGYAPASQDDPASQANHDKQFFDKETGSFTNAAPGGTFVPNEDQVAATNLSGLSGALTPGQ